MKKKFLRTVSMFTVLLASLIITGCSKSDTEQNANDRTTDKLGHKTEAPNALPSVVPPTLSFKEDLTTAKGAVFAYYAYLNFGNSYKACSILSHTLVELIGGASECEKNVKAYAAGVQFTFRDNLALQSAITVDVIETGASAKASATIDAGTAIYTDTFELIKAQDHWEINYIGSLNPGDPL